MKAKKASNKPKRKAEGEPKVRSSALLAALVKKWKGEAAKMPMKFLPTDGKIHTPEQCIGMTRSLVFFMCAEELEKAISS